MDKRDQILFARLANYVDLRLRAERTLQEQTMSALSSRPVVVAVKVFADRAEGKARR